MGAARKRIFGVPPVVLLQKLGVPLPPAVTLAMQHLKAVARNSTGLFRKPGVQSRIQQLQNELENNIGKKLIFCSFTLWQYIRNNLVIIIVHLYSANSNAQLGISKYQSVVLKGGAPPIKDQFYATGTNMSGKQ